MLSKDAQLTEARLADRLGIDGADLRDYVTEVLEERLWRRGESRERRTGFSFKRGTHGGTYVRDPDGTDILPPGVEPPPADPAPR